MSRIRPEDYTRLKALMEVTARRYPSIRKQYAAEHMSAERLRWDIAYMSPEKDGWRVNHLYEYMNDETIDTALARVMMEIDWETIELENKEN